MSARVWTARLGLRDPRALDVTRKSAPPAGLPFAPSWAILRPALAIRRAGDPRAWTVAWEVYREAYIAEMRANYLAQRPAWEALLSRAEVVLCCYCGDPEHCHRTLLAREILPRLGATYEGEVTP